MLLWIILTAMTAAAAVWLSAPLLRQRDARTGAVASELEVYRDQLAEVEREKAEGAIDGDQAEAAGIEIKRRMLTAQREHEGGGDGLTLGERHFAVVAIGAIVVLGSSILYSNLGRPDLPSVSREATSLVLGDRQQGPTFRSATGRATSVAGNAQNGQPGAPASSPQQPAQGAQQGGLGSVDDMIQRLVDRLKKDPGNVETWRMLGWSYFATERFAEAADAYRKATELQPKNATLLSAYGEAMVRAANGEVKSDAAAAFEAALALEPKESRARFFKGLVLEQSGNKQAALDVWIAVLGDAGPDDAWAGDLRARVIELAAEIGVDVTAKLPAAVAATSPPPVAAASTGGILQRLQSRTTEPDAPTAKGPSADAVKAAEAMTPADRQAMIRSMVDGLALRLEKSPRDAEGWIQLIRSRKVLGQEPEAKAALNKALAVFADAPDEQARIAGVAREMAVTP